MLQPMIAMAAEPRTATPDPEPSAADLGRQCLEIVRQALSLGERLDELRAERGWTAACQALDLSPALATDLARAASQMETLTDAGYSEAKAIATLAETRLLAHLAAAAVPPGDRA